MSRAKKALKVMRMTGKLHFEACILEPEWLGLIPLALLELLGNSKHSFPTASRHVPPFHAFLGRRLWLSLIVVDLARLCVPSF